ARSFRRTNDTLITGCLALPAKPPLDPGQPRIQRENHQRHLLEKICPVIEPAEMRHLMPNDLLKFGRSCALQQPPRNQNARSEKADDAGLIDLCRSAELNRATSPDAIQQWPQPCIGVYRLGRF